MSGRNPFGAGTVFQSYPVLFFRLYRGRNPFGAGTVFQWCTTTSPRLLTGRNPFGAGTVFQSDVRRDVVDLRKSQSLWSRDGFSIWQGGQVMFTFLVAIPLEQGRFFNGHFIDEQEWQESQSLWSRDGFSILKANPIRMAKWSQSLWSRDGFSIYAHGNSPGFW